MSLAGLGLLLVVYAKTMVIVNKKNNLFRCFTTSYLAIGLLKEDFWSEVVVWDREGVWGYGCAMGFLYKFEYIADCSMPLRVFRISTFANTTVPYPIYQHAIWTPKYVWCQINLEEKHSWTIPKLRWSPKQFGKSHGSGLNIRPLILFAKYVCSRFHGFGAQLFLFVSCWLCHQVSMT